MGSVTDPNTLSPSRLCSDGKSKGNILVFLKEKLTDEVSCSTLKSLKLAVEVSKPLCRI